MQDHWRGAESDTDAVSLMRLRYEGEKQAPN